MPDLLQWRTCALCPVGPAPSPAGGIFLTQNETEAGPVSEPKEGAQ